MDKIILICASGRSGSTTMQRLINTIPNSNICGENFGAINSLLDFYRKIKYTTFNNVPGHLTPFTYDYLIKKNIKPSWYNTYNFIQLTEMIRQMITNMFKNKKETNVWGFKEIRYNEKNIEYIKDFKELFPQTKVIIQLRENVINQSKSGWIKEDKNAVQYINNYNRNLINFYDKNKNFCYLTSFEKMFDMNNLYSIFCFIDCKEYYDVDKLKSILDNNIKD